MKYVWHVRFFRIRERPKKKIAWQKQLNLFILVNCKQTTECLTDGAEHLFVSALSRAFLKVSLHLASGKPITV